MQRMLESSILESVIDHVFLPPKLPQKDDRDIKRELALLDLVVEALASYETIVGDHEKIVVRSLQRIFDNAKSVFATPQPSEGMQEDNLDNSLAVLDKDETALPLHIQAQNAGVLITRAAGRVLLEIFELSPCNKAVMTTQGRLRRLFPGFAVSVDAHTFSQPEFRHTIVRTLVKMSHQPASDTKPRVKKANQMHEEDRDTVHPRLVTELLGGFLRANGMVETVFQVSKNTREDVLWSSCLAPWRRSPFWLLVRVTLQLSIARSTLGESIKQHLYKRFMVFFMSMLLDEACEHALPPDILHVMNAKIARRVLKLRMDANTLEFERVKCVVERSARMLNVTWHSIIGQTAYRDYRAELKSLNFERDLEHCLPDLDQYVESITSWPNCASSCNFEPSHTLFHYGSRALPSVLDASLYNLVAFEDWVASNLSSWIQHRGRDHDTCANIHRLLLQYHAAAHQTYKGDPEATSRMILVVLELWIACDICARQSCVLLDDYDPGLPSELLQHLLLPTNSLMKRLNHAEQYLLRRQQRARFENDLIFRKFGKPNCFAVQYFHDSTDHQELLTRIYEQAQKERLNKEAEYEREKAKYKAYMKSYDESSCKRESRPDGLLGKHRKPCQHCNYQSQAAALKIHIHEWPLPTDIVQSQNVVFELMVPPFFGYWRDTCLFVIHQVFQYRYQVQRRPSHRHTPEMFQGLRSSFKPFGGGQSIGLLSEVKPHQVTHRRAKLVGHTTLEDICLNHGLHYHYFDERQGVFVDRIQPTDMMQQACTHTLPTQSASLQMYLVPSPEQLSGPRPNTVIARQTDCPQHLSLLEFKALASLPLGFRVMWMSILQQLYMPTVDFKKEETALIVLQCIHQAGPSLNRETLRATHTRLSERLFGLALLGGLNETTQKIRKSWESLLALATLVSLAIRLLELASDEEVVSGCLAFLSLARTTALEWLNTLQKTQAAEVDDSIRSELRLKAAEAALLCVQTFILDEIHLRSVLQLESDASTFIRCSITIHDSEHVLSSVDTHAVKRLYRMWKEISWRAYPIISSLIIFDKSNCLDNALTEQWHAYEPRGQWRCCAEGVGDHWLETGWSHESDEKKFTVHYDLLSGTLLVNGLPLGRLPANYEQHSMYQILFGRTIIEVVPSPRRGMQFSAQRSYAGHHLDFGMHGDTLRVHATAHSKPYMLIPKELLQGQFPKMFVDDYVHWYNTIDDVLEFRPTLSPWTFTKACWKLCRSNRGWRLIKNDVTLVDINSESARTLSSLVATLDDRKHVHITYRSSTRFVEIDLPRPQLGFLLTSDCDFVQSRQFRGLYIDPDQTLNTLIGLQDRLLLRHVSGSRTLILPQGDVSITRHDRHVRVSIDKNSVHRSQAYRIDAILGRLIDNGSLPSKLYLCYIHALTSYFLPDPFTGQTGTEQAIGILRSSAVLSYDVLDSESIELLVRIARLTPRRQYYPAHECVMQTIEWNKNIGALSQHGHFYHCVMAIFENVKKASIFSSGRSTELPCLDHVNPILLSRDDIRSSCWRTAEAGADSHTTARDVTYLPRDREQSSTAAKHVFATSRLICAPQPSIHFPPPHDAVMKLWNFLAQENTISGGQKSQLAGKLEYDATWLIDSAEYLRRHWCYLHRHLHASQSHKYDIAMWLSTIAFSGKVDMYIIQIGVLFLTDRQTREVWPPVADHSRLSEGYTFNTSTASKAIRKDLRPLKDSEEWSLECRLGESVSKFTARQQRLFTSSRDRTVKNFIVALQDQWPCLVPSLQDYTLYNSYINVQEALKTVKPLFEVWYDNHLFRQYLQQIVDTLVSKCNERITLTFDPTFKLEPNYTPGHAYINTSNLFTTVSAPGIQGTIPPIGVTTLLHVTQHSGERLARLIDEASTSTHTRFEDKYVSNLKDSLQHLQTRHVNGHRLESIDHDVFQTYHQECIDYVKAIYASIHQRLTSLHDCSAIAVVATQFPRVSPVLLLQQLNRRRWTNLSTAWKRAIAEYARAIALLQRAERCKLLLDSPAELCKEVINPGHDNWDPMEHPEYLLLEAEHNFLIRATQAQVASEMKRPSATHNTVMQLNMGEGKSSVIVPMVTASLSNGSRLVRVIVAKPQSRQMFHTLVTKLGGLLARRVYRLPFSRDLKPNNHMVAVIRGMCEQCMSQGGVLLLQPEHVLSMQLAGLDQFISGQPAVGQSLLSLQKFFHDTSRDIVDESDENFSVKFELIYTVGVEQTVEMGSARWFIVQQVLDLVRRFAPAAAVKMPYTVVIGSEARGTFPRLRILRGEAWRSISLDVVAHICEMGLVGFPVARLPDLTRQAISKYILERDLTVDDIAEVESPPQESSWPSTFRTTLLLLRGLFAGGVLSFTFMQKRWRVNYGLTISRIPPTQLAVPYRAKDNPTPRAEFSHPDVVIVFTCLSYYYAGLSDDDMFLTLSHLLKSDQADLEYQEWVRDCPNLPCGFRHVTSINLRDRTQCIREVYPALYRTKKVIDYFLAQVVFPKQLKSFPHKLSASGWDIGRIKTHPTTGFSGTNDSRTLLPVDVSYLDMPDQKYTNALVLEYLLQPENSVLLMPSTMHTSPKHSETLISMVVKREPPVRVILDVGAQILELDNIAVAREWLRLTTGHSQTDAVVFFGDDDELNVIDRNDKVESLQTSFFADQLDLCLVFLDEAHTRGTDLRLPSDYRAAVTLGANVTKDKLAQACMRMRKLGHGQSVVFCVPHEIQTRILTQSPAVDVSSILRWAIAETCNDIQSSMPLWRVQGHRFVQQQYLWQELTSSSDKKLTKRAKVFLEDESPSLEQRYRPGADSQSVQTEMVSDVDDHRLAAIQARCSESEKLPNSSAALHEEQERELSPEIERERQVQRPAPADAATHRIHPDLIRSVLSGDLVPDSSAWSPAFQTLSNTSAADLFDLKQLSAALLVTADFASTIRVSQSQNVLDDYQRPVQWILTFTPNDRAESHIDRLLIISPYEAQQLLPKISQSETVTLHLYAPRTSLGFRPLDHLNLYCVGKQSPAWILPRSLKILLNLFAGQVYFQSFDEYRHVCDFLGLAWTKAGDGDVVSADGFILSSSNRERVSQVHQSPVSFLRALIASIRYHGETIDKTHMGVVLNGGLLQEDDFET